MTYRLMGVAFSGVDSTSSVSLSVRNKKASVLVVLGAVVVAISAVPQILHVSQIFVALRSRNATPSTYSSIADTLAVASW